MTHKKITKATIENVRNSIWVIELYLSHSFNDSKTEKNRHKYKTYSVPCRSIRRASKLHTLNSN
jgi:DNA/RNA endonuclease G (NUC1)